MLKNKNYVITTMLHIVRHRFPWFEIKEGKVKNDPSTTALQYNTLQS